ncbi:ATP-binding protein [Paenibacillus stellifer]|uniref:ATP-binding protein n=1 Tax=Paenibacillus stellifer TaxID=169760 RepID=UPI00068A1C3C|nr:ATP-binding protein [Paenibacillus stellifer]
MVKSANQVNSGDRLPGKGKEVIVYGLERHSGVIDGIIRDLQLEEAAFAVKLMLTEAVTNAYSHGNGCCDTKPITIRYSLSDGLLSVQVEDEGGGIDPGFLSDTIEEADLLAESGRGLFLIRSFADEVLADGRGITMVKRI